MLDISFSELLICFLVALVVLGPDRLPAVARAVGRWTGKARTYMRNFSAELERETQVSELKKQLEETQRLLGEQSRQVQTTLDRLGQQASNAAAAPVSPTPSTTPTAASSPPVPTTQEHG
jgi:sec-independent protein translocase protein TatB